MVDSRVKKIAEILVNYSTKVKKGEYVQIVGNVKAELLIKEIYKLVLKKGAFPILKLGFDDLSYIYYKNASEEQLRHFPEIAFEEMKKIDAVIYIGAPENLKQLSNINPKLISSRQKVIEKIDKERMKKKWVIFNFPTSSYAQEAEMSTHEFEDFVYDSCLFDWEEKSKDLDKAVEIMGKGKNVRIVGEDTDISFSIEGRKFVKGDGTMNMPDGEIFTAPVEDSVNGYIKFSFPAVFGGREVDGVRLEFKDGKVVKESASKNENFLKSMLDTDEGSRYLGELGIGLNPGIKKPVKSILFDEKMDKTIHLAIGNAYKECNGTNKSAVHWDFIKNMRNGGKIFLDGELVYENGVFV